MMTDRDVLYYESHVTIEPLYEWRLESINHVAQKHGFRVATLIMRKKREDAPDEPSQDDTFMSARAPADALHAINEATINLVKELRALKINVRRYKIEIAITDSAVNDSWSLLK